jgi:hypothetical protein
MPAHPLSDEELLVSVAAFREHGSQNKAAEALGIPRPTLQCHLRSAAARGLMGTAPVLPGFAIKRTSRQTGPDGKMQKEWVQQAPAPGDPFEIPQGHTIKGVSALVGPDGRELAKWIKTKEATIDPAVLAEDLRKVFAAFEPAARPVPAASINYADHLTLFPWSDPHFGMFAWKGETGQNWDLKTAVRVVKDTFSRVIARTAPTKRALLLIGGDTLHSNTNENRTSRSGHVLQVDGRYPKVLLTACETIVAVIDMVLDKHEEIEVIVIPGNHDEEAAYAVQYFLHAWYRNEKRVKVDLSASLFRFREFGKVMIGTTHGHTVKATAMPEIMASREPEMWGRTRARFIHTFHVHHASKPVATVGGCIAETHEILAPQDAWHFNAGFLSGRSQKSITYDRDKGEVTRVTEAIY